MNKIILVAMATGLLIAGESSADAKGHRGHRGHGGHHGGFHHGFGGGHHGHGRGPFYGLPRCATHYGWHNGHYVTARICKTTTWVN